MEYSPVFFFKIQRLTETWNYLKETNNIKYNLFNRLNEDCSKLNSGDYYLIEKEVNLVYLAI